MGNPGPVLQNRMRLRIIATTDLHMHVLSHDYFSDRHNPCTGFARTATRIREAQGEVQNAILVDNGDFLSGTPAGDNVAHETKAQPDRNAAQHPLISAMNQLGYDAGTLGNHDFDHGLDFLRIVVGQAAFPFVSANAIRTLSADVSEDHTYFPPYTILDRSLVDQNGRAQQLRIGVLGLLPPMSVPQFRSNGAPILTRDIIETARAYVPKMRAQGADIIVALAHSGIGDCEYSWKMENAVIPLAELGGIDAVIAGHNHRVFPGPESGRIKNVDPVKGSIHGIPVVSAGFWGSHLGVIDLELARVGPAWSVQGHTAEARPLCRRDAGGRLTSLAEPDPDVLSVMEKTHHQTLNWTSRAIGRTSGPIHSYFAMIAPSSAVQVIQKAQTWFVETELRDGIGRDVPVLASACPFKCGGLGGAGYFTNIRPGDLTELSVADLYPYPNDLAYLRVSGHEVKEWLERAASVFNQVRPGQRDTPLLAEQTPCYLYEVVYGLEYCIDLTRPARYASNGSLCDPAAHRISDLIFAGRPVPDDQPFILTTSSYRAGGGGQYVDFRTAQHVADLSISMREVIGAYLQHCGILDPTPRKHWRFAAAGGAPVTFRTAPQARDHLAGISDLDVTDLGDERDGFARFRLTL